MVTEWMSSMMNNNAEMSPKAAETHKHMKEHLVVKKAMICQVAALMANVTTFTNFFFHFPISYPYIFGYK